MMPMLALSGCVAMLKHLSRKPSRTGGTLKFIVPILLTVGYGAFLTWRRCQADLKTACVTHRG